MGYLCKYLKRFGWEPTVITQYIPGDEAFAFLKGNTDVTSLHFYKAKGRFARKLEWINVLLFNRRNRGVYREALRQTRKQSYDVILCSTFYTFPLPAARKLARKTRLPLVVDLRDIIEQFAGNEFISRPIPHLMGLEKVIISVYKKINLWQRNRVLREAAHVTTISPWHVEVLKPYNSHISLIYNGYDPELFYPKPVENERFCVTYTGRVPSIAMRNPDLLFQAVARLSGDRIITPDTFRIQWYMDEKSQQIIRQEAEKYPVTEYMDYFDYVPASQIPSLLNASAILLQLTNKTDDSGPKGIMTTKFFEALAVEKPILCVRGDEGCLEDVLNRTQSGLSAHDSEEVYQFVKAHYLQWQVSKQTGIDINRGEVKKFSREAQAKQFIDVFEPLPLPPLQKRGEKLDCRVRHQ
jgi:glycosyltransferase involved in cell wall biosynthesis